jgi:hypothetical protein
MVKRTGGRDANNGEDQRGRERGNFTSETKRIEHIFVFLLAGL